MATASFLPFANLFASLQSLADWFAPRPAPQPAAVRAAVRPLRAPARVTRRPMAVPCVTKPLRVVRVLEPSAPRAGAGRMVISGRLADVCAELDRLAAQEACRGS